VDERHQDCLSGGILNTTAGERGSQATSPFKPLGICGNWFQSIAEIPKSMDIQVPSVKWCRTCIYTMHILPYALNYL
jgi:hypothetical protein